MGRLEIRPPQRLDRNEAQRVAGEPPDDRLARGLLPPALGLPVVHDKVRVAKQACRAEPQNASTMTAVERERAVA
jgi:hypothetical protein